MAHYRSILQEHRNICPMCSKWIWECTGDNHHVMNGAYKKKSEQDGLMLYMHHACHMKLHQEPYVMKQMKLYAQRKMIENGMTIEEWIKRYGKSYEQI